LGLEINKDVAMKHLMEGESGGARRRWFETLRRVTP